MYQRVSTAHPEYIVNLREPEIINQGVLVLCICVSGIHQQNWSRGTGQTDGSDLFSISLEVSQAHLLNVLQNSMIKSFLDWLQCKPH